MWIRLRNDRHIVTMDYSADGQTWERYDRAIEVSGYHHNVAYDFLSLRPALYASGEGRGALPEFQVSRAAVAAPAGKRPVTLPAAPSSDRSAPPAEPAGSRRSPLPSASVIAVTTIIVAIVRGKIEEQRVDEAAGADGCRGADDQSRDRDHRDVRQDQADDLARFGAERHADADLVRRRVTVYDITP